MGTLTQHQAMIFDEKLFVNVYMKISDHDGDSRSPEGNPFKY